MLLAEVILLTRLPKNSPQILSYFSARDLTPGSLVLAPLGRRQEKAIVIETHEIKDYKMEIKKAGYELRPIIKVLNPAPVLTAAQLKLALWLSEYYLAPAGVFLKMMVPKKVTSYKLQVTSQNLKLKTYKLILVPTIAQINTAAKNFPTNKTVVIHSGLKVKQFSENWQKIASGEAEIIIGTRLACFAPFSKLNEIIVKDETNSSHRSWDMFPHYRTHEIARKLTEIFNAHLKIIDKLPSIESCFLNKEISGIKNFCHPSPRSLRGEGSRGLPHIEIVDLRAELRAGNFSIFSRALQDAIKAALKNKRQIILFINRRGLGSFVLCRDCGYVTKCPNCETPMAYHTTKDKNGLKPILICHHCGAKVEPLRICPKCQSRRIKTFGIGTEKVEAEAEKLFKNASILRLDSDIAPKAEQQEKIVNNFKQKKADVLISTQMMFSHALPKAAVIAAISVDTLMHLPDFNADEKMFQTITQLTNFVLPNSPFLIQTYNPENKTLQLAATGDFNTFYQEQIETRKILKYPPFSQIAKLVFRHKDPQKAGREAKILQAKLTQQLKQSKILKEAVFEISEAAPAFIAKEKDKYVWQIIIKFKSYWLASPKSDGGGLEPEESRDELLRLRNKILMLAPTGWEIEIDPESLL